MAIANPGPAYRDRADTGLDLAFRQMTVAHHTPAAGLLHQIGMLGNEGRYFRLDRLGQQTPGADAHHLRQRVLDRNPLWMRKRNNPIFVHRVSFLLGNRRLHHRQHTPPSHQPITKIQPWLWLQLEPAEGVRFGAEFTLDQ